MQKVNSSIQNNGTYFTSSLHEAIVYLASQGWRFIPLYGKKPFLPDWPNAATNNVETLNWWAGAFSGCNWGVALGNGRFVLDVDGDLGRVTLEQLQQEHGKLPLTLVIRSGRKEPSFHYYFNYPSDLSIGNCKLGSGLEIKGSGGQCVFPPSIHPDTGNEYSFVSYDPVANSPQWLLQQICKASASTFVSSHFDFLPPTQFERNTAQKALREDVAKLAALVHGDHRNSALNRTAFNLATMIAPGWIDLTTVETALLGASEKNGHIAKHGLPQTISTLRSGLRNGIQRPREPLPLEMEPHSGLQLTSQAPLPLTPTAWSTRNVELMEMSSVEIKPVQWLWHNYLPRGKLTLLAGAPGTGKSTLAFSMAATISNGGIWPDRTQCKAGHVVIYSTEDDIDDTIAPRLAAMGANSRNIHFIKGTRDKFGTLIPFDITKDVETLKAKILSLGELSLLIVDPITTSITGDMNKSNEVRRGLDSLVRFAAELNCAVLGIIDSCFRIS